MKKILFTLLAATLLLSSCLKSEDKDDLVYYTASTFSYKMSPDVFKVAKVQVGLQYPNYIDVKELTENNDTFTDSVFYEGSFGQMTLGYEVHITLLDTAKWVKQDSYVLGGEYVDSFGQMLYNGNFEDLKTEKDTEGKSYTYEQLKNNIKAIETEFNSTHSHYYTWNRLDDTRYSVTRRK